MARSARDKSLRLKCSKLSKVSRTRCPQRHQGSLVWAMMTLNLHRWPPPLATKTRPKPLQTTHNNSVRQKQPKEWHLHFTNNFNSQTGSNQSKFKRESQNKATGPASRPSKIVSSPRPRASHHSPTCLHQLNKFPKNSLKTSYWKGQRLPKHKSFSKISSRPRNHSIISSSKESNPQGTTIYKSHHLLPKLFHRHLSQLGFNQLLLPLLRLLLYNYRYQTSIKKWKIGAKTASKNLSLTLRSVMC